MIYDYDLQKVCLRLREFQRGDEVAGVGDAAMALIALPPERSRAKDGSISSIGRILGSARTLPLSGEPPRLASASG